MADEPAPPMKPEDALARMASVTQQTRGLRVRTEGLTLVVWSICMMASYLTIAIPFGGREARERFASGLNGTANGTFNASAFPQHGPPATAFFLSGPAALVWFAIALVVTIAIWRSASLSFHTGLSTPRLVAVFVGWLAIFLLTTAVLIYLKRDEPQAWHLVAWAVVMGLFAIFNPLRFSERSRWAAFVLAFLVAIAGAYAAIGDLDPRDTSYLSGTVIGIPGLVAGLYLMLTG